MKFILYFFASFSPLAAADFASYIYLLNSIISVLGTILIFASPSLSSIEGSNPFLSNGIYFTVDTTVASSLPAAKELS